MSASARRSGTSRRGLSAARCGTSCSAGGSWTSTSPARIPSWPRASTRASPAAPSSRSRSATAPGASPSGRGTRSTSHRFTATRSRRTSRRGTSRSTRSRGPWPAGRSSTRSAASPTWRRAACARSGRPSSRTTLCGSYARCASRTSSDSGSTRRPRSSCGASAGLVGEPAGERVLGELERLSPDGFRRADELGLLEPLGGSTAGLDRVDPADTPGFKLVAVFGERLQDFPISNDLRRLARTLLDAERPADGSPREIHRFRRRTEPWALSALAFLGATDLYDAVRVARAEDPAEPLLRGEDVLELGVEPGPEVGRLLELVAEERAVGTIATREGRARARARSAQRHLMVQPTAGVSCTSGAVPATAASRAGRRYGSAPTGSWWSESGAPW